MFDKQHEITVSDDPQILILRRGLDGRRCASMVFKTDEELRSVTSDGLSALIEVLLADSIDDIKMVEEPA